MFRHYFSFALVAKRKDKMCLWSTAGTPKLSSQVPSDTLFKILRKLIF